MKRLLLASALLVLAAFAADAGLINVGGNSRVPLSAVGVDADFAARCAGPGVQRCIGFDSSAWIPNHNPTTGHDRGYNFGLLTSDDTYSVIDTGIKSSGAGSLRHTFPAGAGNLNVLTFFAHFKPCPGASATATTDCAQPYDGGGLNAGDEIYIQWRARYNTAMLTDSNFLDNTGMPINDSGFKVADVGLADTTACLTGSSANSIDCPTTCPNQGFELVETGGSDTNLIGSYVNCAGPYSFRGLRYTPDGGNTWSVQNKITGCSNANGYSGCRRITIADQWYTFKLHIKMGHFNTFDNEVQFWMGSPGQAPEKLIDCSAAEPKKCDFEFNNQAGIANNGVIFNLLDPNDGHQISSGYKVGKFYLLPYITNLNSVVADATVWYDELIISTQDIADPGQSGGGTVASLSSPTPSGTIGTATAATLGATSNVTSGTFYSVVDNGGALSGITAAQIKAGQKASGASALKNCNAAVVSTTPSCGVTGLTTATSYVYASVQNTSNGDSNIVTGSFTSASPPTLSSATPSGTLGTTTGATLGATANQSSGTFYGVVDTDSLSGITAAQVKAAHDAANGAVVSSCNGSVSSSSPNCNASGLTASTGYNYAVVQSNGNGDSNVLTGTFTTAASGGTALQTLISGMSSNSFAQLTGMGNWNSGLIFTPQFAQCVNYQDVISEFANKGVWDPIGHRWMFSGAPHGNCSRFVVAIYDEATNSWSVGPQAVTDNALRHSYDVNALNTSTGDLYYREYNSVTEYKLAENGSSWTQIASIPYPGSKQCCGAQDWMPNIGRLVFVDGDWGIYSYNPGGNSWTHVFMTNGNDGTGLPQYPMDPYNIFAVYSSTGVLVFGGGPHIYKWTGSGTASSLSNPPFGTVNAGGGQSCCSVVPNPVNGDILVINNGDLWKLNPSTNTWTQISITLPSFFNNSAGSLIGAPTEYGVVMYVKCNESNECRVYVYKP